MNKNIEKLLSEITDWIEDKMINEHGSFDKNLLEVEYLSISDRAMIFVYKGKEYSIKF